MTNDASRKHWSLLSMAAIAVVASIAVLLILRLQPGMGAGDDDDGERPAADVAPAIAAGQEDFVVLSDEAIRIGNIELAAAGPARIFEILDLTGTLSADPAQVRRVEARFPGVVQEVRVAVGDHVAAGAVVASVESDDSLQKYTVRAPISGVVSERGVSPGEHSGDQPIVTIINLSHVWVEVPLFARDAAAVLAGMGATVSVDGGTRVSTGTVAYVSPIGSPGSQTTTARIVLANDGRWIPGMVVSVRVRTRELAAVVTVPRAAIQRHEGKDVVFLRTGKGFRVQPVQVGVDDGQTVEIRGGLKGGERVVTSNSYVVLAELEKGSQASDD